MVEVSLIVAFVAGIVSFLSPCVLPIIPGFLAYLSGVSLQESKGRRRLAIFINSVFFVLGFSVIFALLGVLLNTILAGVAYEAQTWLARIGGTIVIVFGLYLTGLITIGFLEREHKFRVKRKFSARGGPASGWRSRYATSFVFGSAFAAGWTPCVGAALGAILGLAASSPGSAFSLLMSYSLGLGLPFLAVGLFASGAAGIINKYAKVLKYVNIIFGVVLIVLGILVFTESLNLVANFGLLNKFLLQ